MELQTKLLSLEAIELKMDDARMSFAGYASVFNKIDQVGDTIDPAAYTKTLQRGSGDRQIKMRWNHRGPVIGKWTRMEVDEKGLWVEGELTPGHSVAQDVYASMKHGAVDGLSIGYTVKDYKSLSPGNRLLKELNLIEISVVEDPADLGAKITDVKSMLDETCSLKEIETFLREVGGFSKTDSIALIARMKRLALGEQEAEEKAKQEIAKLFQINL